jgi:hypothetical protein
MDRTAAVITRRPQVPTATEGPVLCEQAIFTSARSATGEGYRLVASSPGVQVAEKIEITRRSPSHGGLCEEDPQAVGLEAYKLPTGRHCVAYCGYAGCEQTARGGLRVYTHAVVLDRQAWQRYQANPVPVHAAIARHVEESGPAVRPGGKLEKITLTPPPPTANLPTLSGGYGSDSLERAMSAAADLLAGRQLILLDATGSFRLLERVLLSLPLEMRENLDASVGVRFSPARRMRLVLTDEPEAELQRRIAGLNIQLRRAEESTASQGTLFEGWERLLRRWWREGRRHDIMHLTEVCGGTSCDALDRIAALCEATDALDGLSVEAVRSLMARYGDARPATKAEQTLVQDLLQRAAERLASQPGSPN